MYEIEPYIQRPNDFHQCFEYVTHDTRCTQTAIQGEYFCPRHRISPSPILLYPDGGFSLPALTDRDTILQVASQIAQRLAYNAIDAKRAGKILYACQLANSALDGKLRDQKLARQQTQSEADDEKTTHPAPTPRTRCHSEPQPKNPGSSPATKPESPPTTPSEGEQNLSISAAANPQPLFQPYRRDSNRCRKRRSPVARRPLRYPESDHVREQRPQAPLCHRPS